MVTRLDITVIVVCAIAIAVLSQGPPQLYNAAMMCAFSPVMFAINGFVILETVALGNPYVTGFILGNLHLLLSHELLKPIDACFWISIRVPFFDFPKIGEYCRD